MQFLLVILVVTIEFLLFAIIECKVCQTEVCQKLVKELKIIMDNKVDPCDDFSAYVCGNFEKLHSIPPGESEFSSIAEIQVEINKELRNLLDKQSMVNRTDPKAKAKIFYQSCLDMKKRNKQSKFQMRKLAQSMIKQKTYEANLINLMRSGLTTRIMDIGPSDDPGNLKYYILSISKPELVLSEIVLQSPDSVAGIKQIHNYKKYMNSVLDTLGMWKNDREIIDQILVLHVKIAKALPSLAEQSDPDKYSKVRIKDLRSCCFQISWRKFFDNLLKGTGKTFNDNDMVLVFSLKYIDSICSLLKEYISDPIKKRVLEMDLQWAAIDSVVGLGSENLVNIADQLKMDNYGITGKQELWKTCLEVTSLTLIDIMGHMYITNFFQASKKKNIIKIIDDIRKSLRNVINNIQWMDSKTKEEALKKLSSMKYKIGYPDSLLSEVKLNQDNENITMVLEEFLKNYINYRARKFIKYIKKIKEKIPDDRWIVGAHLVNAFNNPLSNEIIFPAAILRYPFYDIGLPFHVNYGGIGSVVGHEILHGFDTQGSKYDEKGSHREWWTNSSRKEYARKVECIRQQYSSYSIENQTLPANQTIGEDIADNAGLRMAYMAAFSLDENREHLNLSGIGLTPEQLFFVSYSKNWCSLYTKNALLEKLRNDVHTVQKYRINGPLSNMAEFSKAFKCDASKKMNRLEKCLVW